MTSGRRLGSRWIADALAISACVALLIAAPRVVAADPCADGGKLTPSTADGIGGTGLLPAGDGEEEPQGIGGTGRTAGDPDEEGGIGGTGVDRSADAAVVGVVTGFASVCVGGREIHYDAATQISQDGAPADAAGLAVGQLVEVSTLGSRALHIDIRSEVEGTIAAIDAESGRIEVLGQSVILDAATWTDLESGPGLAEASMFRLGDAVRVSGFRGADESIVASRIEAVDSATPRLRGSVERIGDGEIVVAGVPVRTSESVQIGDLVRVDGSWNGDALSARSVAVQNRLPSAGGVKNLRLEGIARRSASTTGADELFVAGIPVDTGLLGAPQIGERVRVEAVVRDGVAVAERITPVQPRSPARPAEPGQRPVVRPSGPDRTSPGAAGPAMGPGAAQPAAPRDPAALRMPRNAPERPRRILRPDRPERPIRPQRLQRPPRPERPIRPLPPVRP